MTGLQIAPTLTLPLEMVTEPIGILANRGRGKSYATHVLVEEIHNAGVPVVVLDVKGDWWGLRTAADGKADGLPFYIFGGDHADIPLEPTAGELLADLVVNERVSVVLDLSIMSKTKARSFTVAFAERLYFRNRDPLFLVVDEADVLIPQRSTVETARLLGAMEDIAKRGRGRGLGMAVVTQRPQEVAKSVLDLMDTLILLGMTGPRSLKSINEWISGHVDEDTTAGEVMASLPSLPVGEAWIWSPMQQLLKRISVAQIRTFDSHFTPKPGEKRRAPQGRADLDLASLGEQMAATVERAQANDPKALRNKVSQLERELAKLREEPAPQPVVEQVEVPVLTKDDRWQLGELKGELAVVKLELERAEKVLERIADTLGTRPASARQVAHTARPAPVPQQPRPPSRAAAGPGSPLPGAQRKILTALAQHGPQEKTSLAILTGYSHKGGGFNNPVGAMRTAGYITPAGVTPIDITDAGLEALGDYEPLPAGRDLLEWWLPQLSGAEKKIVSALDQYGPMEKVDLAAAAGYDPKGGGFNNPIGHLRTLGILTKAGVTPIDLAPEMRDA